ncbi:MAG: hypothetical protein M0R80_01965 [Proteobacteria bacterium]|jgi:hypothetical protein|nr:hypothetical protein [Pseudomonadota bacterium]
MTSKKLTINQDRWLKAEFSTLVKYVAWKTGILQQVLIKYVVAAGQYYKDKYGFYKDKIVVFVKRVLWNIFKKRLQNNGQ